MNKQEAIELMKTSANVNEWNTNREKVKYSADEKTIIYIDQSGLITDVLGRDFVVPHVSTFTRKEVINEPYYKNRIED